MTWLLMHNVHRGRKICCSSASCARFHVCHVLSKFSCCRSAFDGNLLESWNSCENAERRITGQDRMNCHWSLKQAAEQHPGDPFERQSPVIPAPCERLVVGLKHASQIWECISSNDFHATSTWVKIYTIGSILLSHENTVCFVRISSCRWYEFCRRTEITLPHFD